MNHLTLASTLKLTHGIFFRRHDTNPTFLPNKCPIFAFFCNLKKKNEKKNVTIMKKNTIFHFLKNTKKKKKKRRI
jgi:hypothetical protein